MWGTSGYNRRSMIIIASSAVLLLSHQPILADDNPKTAEQLAIDAATAKAQLLDAQAKLVKSEADLMKARMDALGISPATGTTTLKEDAGQMEAWMLSAGTVNKAGAVIAQRIKAAAGTQPVLLADRGARIDFSLPITLKASMSALLSAGVSTRGNCKVAQSGDGTVSIAGLPLAAIGAALSLLKTDVEISKLDVNATDALLIDAIASNDGNWVIIDELAAPAKGTVNDAIDILWGSLLAERTDLSGCRATLAAKSADAEQARIAKIDAIVAKIDALETSLNAQREGKASLLVEAMQLDSIQLKKPFVLKVAIEKAGGSLLKRTNVWTALGAPAIGLTGGLVARYTLSDPETGMVKAAGVLVCRTALTNFNAVHRGKVAPSDCATETTSNGGKTS